MGGPKTVEPAELRPKLIDPQVLVVCAADEERARELRLDGALTLEELRERLPRVHDEQEIIFYGEDGRDQRPMRVAERYLQGGYHQVAVVMGGLDACLQAGLRLSGAPGRHASVRGGAGG